MTLTFALGAAACSNDSPPGPSGPGPPLGAITEVPTTLPPRTALENAIKDQYARLFTEPVFRPAIVNDPNYVNCSGQGHLTSTLFPEILDTTPDGRSR